jgi:hypothetical protein
MTQYVGPMNGRPILYPNQVPYDTDFLREAEYRMVDIAFLCQTVLGFGNSNANIFCGLTVTQSSSPDLAVTIGQGAMYQVQQLEPIVYGNPAAPTGIGPLTTPTVFKQAINISAITEFGLGTFTVPSVGGQSQYYLIQVAFSTVQTNSVNRPYYNPSNPSSPNFNNLPDTEWDIPTFSIVAGTPGVSPAIPSPTGGATGLYTVLLAHGATTIVNADIAPYSTTTFVTETLTQKISETTADSRYVQISTLQAPNVQQFNSGSGTYTTPAGAVWLRVRGAAGGGGSGGSSAGGSATNGGTGGNTTFGTALIAAVGGSGSIGGAGGVGGSCSGATTNWAGAYGADGVGNSAGVNATANGGQGGGSVMFGGGQGAPNAAAGIAGVTNTGGGASGAGVNNSASACSGGGGGGGGGSFEYIINAPNSTYAYAVGAGGTAGISGGGTGSAVGAAGAAGKLIIEAFFS